MNLLKDWHFNPSMPADKTYREIVSPRVYITHGQRISLSCSFRWRDTNLIYNPSFENNGDGWSLDPEDAPLHQDFVQAPDAAFGEWVLRQTAKGIGDQLVGTAQHPSKALDTGDDIGDSFYFEAWIRKLTSGATGSAQMGFILSSSTPGLMIPPYLSVSMADLEQGQWTKVSGFSTPQWGSVRVQLLAHHSMPQGETIEWDGLYVSHSIDGKDPVQLVVECYDYSNSLVATTKIDSYTDHGPKPETGWRNLGGEYITPPGTTYIVVKLVITQDAADGVIEFADVDLRQLTVPITTVNRLDEVSRACERWRSELEAKRYQSPIIRFWKNKQSGEPGLEYVGRVDYYDTIRASFPFKENEPSQGELTLRADHWIAEWIRSVAVDEEAKKNIVITVDFYGGELRWSGLLKHQTVRVDEDGRRFQELVFMDDLQFLQFMLGPPNPALPIPVFQFPRVFPLMGPAKWAISVMILLNLIRLEGNLWVLPDDPFNPDEWLDIVQWNDWQCHIKCKPFALDDSSLWVLLATRMNPMDAVIADALEDARLTLKYRRVFTDLGEAADGVLFVSPTGLANGALVFELVDNSGYHSPLGTYFSGTIVDGMVRSVITYAGGFIEDTLNLVDDHDTLIPDAYWGPGFLGTLAEAPWLVIRDNQWSEVKTSELTYAPATAVSVCVGGSNPTADAVARLVIETVGGLLGYFLLGGFSTAGVIAADLIMPFLQGTIAAWLYWKNTTRAQQLGWVHLWEIFQNGAENNAWSLSALAALRGGFLATRPETSHKLSLEGTRWILPGLHFDIGSRVGSTCKEYPNYIFVNPVKEILPSWDHAENRSLDYEVTIGEAKATMSLGERQARAFQKFLVVLQDIGVHLIS